MSDDLRILVERARQIRVSPSDIEAQRRSFALANVRLEDSNVTSAGIDRAAEVLAAEDKRCR